MYHTSDAWFTLPPSYTKLPARSKDTTTKKNGLTEYPAKAAPSKSNGSKPTHTKPPVTTHTITHARLFETFMMLIDPLMTKKDFYDQMCSCLNSHPTLLKTVSHQHKRLQREILQYIEYSNGEDTSYLNKPYILFWCNLFNSNIYMVHKNQYQKFGTFTNGRSIVIKREDGRFEYVNDRFEAYCLNVKLYEAIDVSTLASKKKDDLLAIAKTYKIQIEPKMTKIDILLAIRNRLE